MLYQKRQLCRPPYLNPAEMWFSFKICGLRYKQKQTNKTQQRLGKEEY